MSAIRIETPVKVKTIDLSLIDTQICFTTKIVDSSDNAKKISFLLEDGTNFTVSAGNWDTSRQRVKEHHKDSGTINAMIDNHLSLIRDLVGRSITIQDAMERIQDVFISHKRISECSSKTLEIEDSPLFYSTFPTVHGKVAEIEYEGRSAMIEVNRSGDLTLLKGFIGIVGLISLLKERQNELYPTKGFGRESHTKREKAVSLGTRNSQTTNKPKPKPENDTLPDGFRTFGQIQYKPNETTTATCFVGFNPQNVVNLKFAGMLVTTIDGKLNDCLAMLLDVNSTENHTAIREHIKNEVY